ncbi:hypothetical protein WA026_001432 [Henosepilachna vigintioctopunctata]|uniref:Uncharacterized protein n=1 Tax=Henosepilachna vigintioctopunctata TaxID=420089 RepID=A0AAW1UPW9_9CUCU
MNEHQPGKTPNREIYINIMCIFGKIFYRLSHKSTADCQTISNRNWYTQRSTEFQLLAIVERWKDPGLNIKKSNLTSCPTPDCFGSNSTRSRDCNAAATFSNSESYSPFISV